MRIGRGPPAYPVSRAPVVHRWKTRGLVSDNRGIVFVFVALMMLPAIGLAFGSSIDYSRWAGLRIDLQNAVDAAALSALSALAGDADLSLPDAESYADNYLQTLLESLAYDIDGITVSVDVRVEVEGTITARATASAQLNTTFLNLLQIEELAVRADATANYTLPPMEIAIALDISGSMIENTHAFDETGTRYSLTRIRHLTEQLSTFLSDVFKAYLRASPTATQSRLAVSVLPFSGGVNLGFTAAELGVTFARYDSDRTAKIGRQTRLLKQGDIAQFHGCFEYDHLDKVRMRDRMKTDAFRPFPDMDYIDYMSERDDNYHWCPGSTAIEDGRPGLPFTRVSYHQTQMDTLLDQIEAMKQGPRLLDGTALDTAFLWSYRVISPIWRGKFPTPSWLPTTSQESLPRDYGDENRKLIVMMTDGEINISMETFGYVTRRDKKYGRVKGGKKRWGELCEHAKTNGVRVYTVGYRVDATSQANQDLSTCASPESHFIASENRDLNSIFDSVKATFSVPRLVQ